MYATQNDALLGGSTGLFPDPRDAGEDDNSRTTIPIVSFLTTSLQRNQADVGGALWLKGVNTTIKGFSTLHGNNGTAFGGAVYLLGGNMDIQDQVVISNNNAAQGGGIALYSSCLERLEICPSSLQLAAGAAVVYNNASIAGGGILMDSSLAGNFTRNGSVVNNSASLGDPDVLYARKTCNIGEVLKGGWCEKCASNMYTFASNATECNLCPPHANCTGGASLQPDPGYWRSHFNSSQIHACPNAKACNWNRNDSSNSLSLAASDGAARAAKGDHNASIYTQCAEGYSGNACGVCSNTSFGLTSPFVCKRCWSQPATIAIYAVALLCLVALLTYMADATWHDNQEVTNELRVSDVLKVLVLYVQYLVVLGMARVVWPDSLSAVFSAATFLFSSSSGQFISLDCLLSEMAGLRVPMAVVKQLIYLVLPFVVMVAVCIVYAVFVVLSRCWSHRGWAAARAQVSLLSTLLARLPVVVLVVLYTFFPSLVRVGLSFYACLHLDVSPAVGEFANATAAHGYWVYDMQQECMAPWHKVWALGLGIPCVLIFCLGVPVVIVAWLVATKAKLYEPGFRLHFGSLYRNFRSRCFYWEAVVAVQTLVLVCVAVFSNTIGPYYLLVMFAFLFSLSLVLQVWFRPFAFAKLHHLQLSAMGCLYVTAFISLTFIDVGDSPGTVLKAYRFAMGIVLLLVNVAFVGWAVYNLALSSKGAAGKLLGAVKGQWVQLRRWVATLRGESIGAASIDGSPRGIEITSLGWSQGEPKPESYPLDQAL